MTTDLKTAADTILERCATGSPRVPGVVAVATDRHGNL
jgi:methyl acetate hydrolase